MAAESTARSQRGQATLEHLGLALVLAIVLAAAAPWLAARLRPPEHPPRFVDAAAQPLVSAESWIGRNVNPLAGLQPWTLPRGRDDEPIGWFLRTAGPDLCLRVIRVPDPWSALACGAAMQAVARARALVQRPVATLTGPVRRGVSIALDPASAASGAVADALAYVRRLRGMPASRAWLTATVDLGAWAADAGISRGAGAARAAALGRLREGLRRP
jgi:hypothetical protein